MNNDISRIFSEGLVNLSLSLDPADQQKLLDFLIFLRKWSSHYNLTAITDLEKMVSHHLLDSLSIAPLITGEHILDVGSGAGFPGIPLAVYFPKKQWTLLDCNGKKARFLIQSVAELKLQNVTVIHDRAEYWQAPQKFDLVVVRAVGAIKEVLAQTRRHVSPRGQWIFMKGEYQYEKLDCLQPSAVIHSLSVPGVTTPRYAITISADAHFQHPGVCANG